MNFSPKNSDTIYLKNTFYVPVTLQSIIVIKAGCWRADCDALIGRHELNIASARQHHTLIKDNSP